LSPNSKLKTIEEEKMTSSNKKNNEERKFEEDLQKALEESKKSSSKKTLSHDLIVEEDKTFEEQLKKAMSESMMTYEKKKNIEENWEREEYYDSDKQMELEDEPQENTGDIFQEYKSMIYEGGPFFHQSQGYMNENSMFPLSEEQLSPAYLLLEKNQKR